MFERYTEKARRTIFFARYEASQFGAPSIESEHLLLGILREDKALANQFLHSHGSVESIRKQVEGLSVPRERISTAIDLPLSNECKRILGYAAQEADKFSHSFISTGHLFIGVLRVQDCFAAKLLHERGVALEMARERIGSDFAKFLRERMLQQQLGPTPKSPGLPSGYASHRLLYNDTAETLILELRSSAAFHLPTRLFARHQDKEVYEQIGSPTEEVSYESPVTCDSLPVVMFNSTKWEKTGGNWDGVYSFNLNTKELEVCVSPQSLRLLESHGRLWITELVSLSEDARALYINMGVERIVSGGGVVHYYLSKLSLPGQEVTLLSRLLDIRF